MEILDAWNVFETTGRVEDYLNYRNRSKDMVNETGEHEFRQGQLTSGFACHEFKQVGVLEHGGTNNIDGDGAIDHADWGI